MIIDLAITISILGAVGVLVYWIVVLVPTRRQYRVELQGTKIDRNHQELFLLVNDLLTIHEIGYQVIFPDEKTLKRAQDLTATYRRIVTE